ncbi:hypothetical protein [Streptomyces antnestii]|uniref:hypothetical protein n=1 Tax=Streptomyces antnestii TaxID=2494256 RepID=UPI0016791B28|nr:hypothetical protein [Streptomyces sp. San01]
MPGLPGGLLHRGFGSEPAQAFEAFGRTKGAAMTVVPGVPLIAEMREGSDKAKQRL